MITFTVIFKNQPGFTKIRARSFRQAVESARAMGADRVLQGGFGWDSGWLK